MIALLLAAALMGPPAPARADDPVPVEKLADDLSKHLAWIAAGATIDLTGTGYGLKHCPSCFEANPIGGQSGDIGIVALKMGSAVGVGLITFKLERGGHHKWATGLSLSYAAIGFLAGGQNFLHGIRGR